MVFRNADLGIHIGQSTMLLALFFVIMTVCPHLANQFSPVLGMLLNIAAMSAILPFMEDMHYRVRKRIVGNIAGVIFYWFMSKKKESEVTVHAE